MIIYTDSSMGFAAKSLWVAAESPILSLVEPMSLAWVILGVSWPPTPKDIPEPSHGRVFCEKFRSVYVVKGVWSLLTDLLFNRYWLCQSKCPDSKMDGGCVYPAWRS